MAKLTEHIDKVVDDYCDNLFEDSGSFLEICKRTIAEYFNRHVDKTDNKQICVDDVYVVWFCKTLQNGKALLSTAVPDGMYYEITYNGDRRELYLDAYKKWDNQCYDCTPPNVNVERE